MATLYANTYILIKIIFGVFLICKLMTSSMVCITLFGNPKEYNFIYSINPICQNMSKAFATLKRRTRVFFALECRGGYLSVCAQWMHLEETRTFKCK